MQSLVREGVDMVALVKTIVLGWFAKRAASPDIKATPSEVTSEPKRNVADPDALPWVDVTDSAWLRQVADVLVGACGGEIPTHFATECPRCRHMMDDETGRVIHGVLGLASASVTPTAPVATLLEFRKVVGNERQVHGDAMNIPLPTTSTFVDSFIIRCNCAWEHPDRPEGSASGCGSLGVFTLSAETTNGG